MEAALCATPPLMNEEGVKAAAEPTMTDAMVSFMVMKCIGQRRWRKMMGVVYVVNNQTKNCERKN